jgi:tetratricopeptide (TPR) repeat protein
VISADMLPSLERLSRAELVRQALDEELTYIFKHALVQDTVYSTLLKHERRRLHSRVAESLEQNFPQEKDALAATLSQHYWESEAWEKTVTYSLLAGEHALQRYAMREALDYYDRALAALEQVASPSPLQEYDAWMGLAEASRKFRPYAAQLEYLARAETIARELIDKPRLARVLYTIGGVHTAQGHNLRAGVPLAECFTLADELADERLAIIPTYFMGMATLDANPRQALGYYERAIELAQRYGNLDIEAVAWSAQAWALARLGEFAEARAAVDRAQALLHRVKSPMLASDVDLFAGWSFLDMGDTRQGLEFGQRGLDKALASENMDCVCGAYLCVGFVQLAAQRLPEAQGAFQEAIQHSQFSGADAFENLGRAGLAVVQFHTGRRDAVADLERAWTHAHTLEDRMGKALIAQSLGEIYRLRGDVARAKFFLDDALAFFRPTEMAPYLVRTLEMLAQVDEQAGQIEKAEQARAEAAQWQYSVSNERNEAGHEN